MKERIEDETPERTTATRSKSTSSWGYLWLLLPGLCCGLPLMVTLLAAASAVAQGAIVGLVVALIGVGAFTIKRRRSRGAPACGAPRNRSNRTPTSSSTEQRQQ